MPNIINPNCPSLPQQVEKNKQDILKLFASNLEELSGLDFIPNSVIYQQEKAIISGKFIVTRDDSSIEIDGVVTLPIKGENGIIVDGSEDNLKIRIALDQSDRELFDYVQELVNRTTESDEIVFTSDMQNFVEDFVTEANQNNLNLYTLYDKNSDDININLGFTAGLNANVDHNLNFSYGDNDFAIFVFELNENTRWNFKGIVVVDLKNSNNPDGGYQNSITLENPYSVFQTHNVVEFISLQAKINSTKTNTGFMARSQLVDSNASNNTSVIVSKIIGGKYNA